jgi:hypothetical protein
MEFEIKFGGKRLGVVRFEVDASVYMPILTKLGFFGLGFQPVEPEPEPEPKKAGKR